MRMILGFLILAMAAHAAASEPATLPEAANVDLVTNGLTEPWSFAFLPDGGVLITERGGVLWHRRADGQMQQLQTGLEIAVAGQGGLLDVVAARDFAETRQVFLSYVKPQGRGSGTALATASLSPEGDRLQDVRVIFEMLPGATGGFQFGSRIVEAPDGTLFLTLGDRADAETAQDLGNHNGTIVRLGRDGTVPADNPFVGVDGAQPEIWSYGHRNPQGAALDAQGQLWVVEHGARGGDEVNVIVPGTNYGWPVIAYGRHYSGAPIGEGTAKEGMAQPEFYWDPSMAPSGMMIYSGRLWPQWTGDIFVGSLKFDYIARLAGTPLEEVEQLAGPETLRVRDIREAPDGSIWFLSVGQGALYRMTPP